MNAKTIAHEVIHASIYKYVDQYKKGIEPNDRPNLFFWYNYYNAQNAIDTGTTYAQHQHMQDTYVIPLAKAIRQLDNYRYPLENYLGFGWEGLKLYKYDKYLDANGNEKVMTPDEYRELIKKKDNIAASSNFAPDCK